MTRCPHCGVLYASAAAHYDTCAGDPRTDPYPYDSPDRDEERAYPERYASEEPW